MNRRPSRLTRDTDARRSTPGLALRRGATEVAEADRGVVLVALGERVRTVRARCGLTRKDAARAAEVSERHLANLESGTGNPSLLVLEQVARALGSSVAELVGDVTTSSPEWLLIRELLQNRSEDELRRARLAIGEALGVISRDQRATNRRVALIGLRGAGKSTLGQMLADDLGFPFVELSYEIEKLAGSSIGEIHDLYGTSAYRRCERRALEESIQLYSEAIIAAPGGIVSDAATFNLLLSHCTTVWLQAKPEDYMRRVAMQGDFRPMRASSEAMADLRRILEGRSPLYARANLTLDTSRQPLSPTFGALRAMVRDALQLSA
jgi:XRE family transcriptional regulator, aerobic/anaerobic benzoate catabolism transcriptional regulator